MEFFHKLFFLLFKGLNNTAAWRAEFVDVPEFTESTIHVVAGLLLPIWKRLPNESTGVYRLQTNAGERAYSSCALTFSFWMN